jgi:hypothetical protein
MLFIRISTFEDVWCWCQGDPEPIGQQYHHKQSTLSNNFFLNNITKTLIIYGFTSPSWIFHLYGDVSPLPVTGLQNLGLCLALRAFEQQGIFIVPWDLGFSGLIRKTAPFSRLLWHTMGCGGCLIYSNLDPHWDKNLIHKLLIFQLQCSSTIEVIPPMHITGSIPDKIRSHIFCNS